MPKPILYLSFAITSPDAQIYKLSQLSSGSPHRNISFFSSTFLYNAPGAVLGTRKRGMTKTRSLPSWSLYSRRFDSPPPSKGQLMLFTLKVFVTQKREYLRKSETTTFTSCTLELVLTLSKGRMRIKGTTRSPASLIKELQNCSQEKSPRVDRGS